MSKIYHLTNALVSYKHGKVKFIVAVVKNGNYFGTRCFSPLLEIGKPEQ